MEKADALVKVGGSKIEDPKFYEWLLTIKGKYRLFIVCGGGKAISAELKKSRVSSKFIGGQRVIRGERGRKLACEVLERQSEIVEDWLRKYGIKAVVHAPVARFGNRQFGIKLCQINGDNLAKDLWINFRKTFIVTSEETEKFIPPELADIIEIIRL